ncbi:Rrf2 family transcriptional regulator [Methanotorris formicicus]|uniref:ACT domain-containing protein n=1 Tax=Methanotorris formicicus Mc-S-70 TaxID=647171 RepID=H1KXY0_9EURY|nr:Rrf2 family transcriptional regulator [Methanotorris formicicus]EHP87764.1 protein of unknown function UPF0074 [Methanotorris formicicus Mc-S-70]
MKVSGLTKEIMELLKTYSTTKEIAEKLNMHPKNIDRHIRTLRDLGLVETKKGKKGGIKLTKDGRYLIEKGEINLSIIKVQIIAKDRIGLLAEITSKISEINGNILSTTLEKDNEDVIIWLVIENVDIDELREKLKDTVKKLIIL